MSTPVKPIILSIQSHVAWCYVGNSAAVFALQRLGFEVLQVHTVLFSNHTGYGQFRGQILSAEHIQSILTGLRERGVLHKVGAVLSGYLGNAETGSVILDAVGDIRHANPQLRYLCDPVMGDVGRGLFVNPAIPNFLRDQAIPFANIITPNQFEFELLTGAKLASVGEAVAVARQLRGRGAPDARPGPRHHHHHQPGNARYPLRPTGHLGRQRPGRLAGQHAQAGFAPAAQWHGRRVCCHLAGPIDGWKDLARGAGADHRHLVLAGQSHGARLA